MGVKGIVVVTNHRICKQTHIQTHLKGADLMSPGIVLHPFSVKAVLMGDKVVHGIVDSVKMSPGVGTSLRVAFHFLTEADFLLGRQGHCLK